MRRSKMSGFTLVELVIIIAVIGILSLVSIPVFGSINENSRVNADNSIAAGLNTNIATASDEIKSEQDLKDIINFAYGNEKGYENLNPQSKKSFWYDIANNEVIVASAEELPDTPSNDAAIEVFFENGVSDENRIHSNPRFFLIDKEVK